MPYNQRTCYCGDVDTRLIGHTVQLTGWVHNRRDHGGIFFIDLRDRAGRVQLKFDSQSDPQCHELAATLKAEYCIAVRGEVVARPEGLVNPNMKTGAVEVNVREVDVLSKSDTPPFEIADDVETNEEMRLKYRYLDLRRPTLQKALITRARITKAMRDYFEQAGFLEIETPFLTKSTPEGARDYLVPSRIHPGNFYALPQSPQIFKQLLMMSGFDRYVQIVRCFRDEDLRADRQPEFTQLDLEMSFVQPEDVQIIVEGLLKHVMKIIHGIEIPTPFPRMTYRQAMEDYGIDRPDTRYDLRIKDVSTIARKMEFKVFAETLAAGGVVRCIRVPGGADMTRKQTDALAEDLKGIGAGGLPMVKVAAEGGATVFQTGIAKFFNPETTAELLAATQAAAGDVIFFAAGSFDDTCKHLSWLREVVARQRKLIPEGQWNFLWVVDFPMFLYDAEVKRHFAVHHPFTAPRDEDVARLDGDDPTQCRAKAYDVVLNGVELGGGSIRIHRREVQEKVFKLLEMSPEEQQSRFGFLLEALKYGPPPHGGIALGLDRMAMLLSGYSNIRDVIAFPKTAKASCLMSEAPSRVANAQLDELGIAIKGQ